jgi:hypothetical protein
LLGLMTEHCSLTHNDTPNSCCCPPHPSTPLPSSPSPLPPPSPSPSTPPTGVMMLQLLTGLPAQVVISTVEGALSRCKGDPASLANILDKRAGEWPLTGGGGGAGGRGANGGLWRGSRGVVLWGTLWRA